MYGSPISPALSRSSSQSPRGADADATSRGRGHFAVTRTGQHGRTVHVRVAPMLAHHRAEANRGPLARISNSVTAVASRLFSRRGDVAGTASRLPRAGAAPAPVALRTPSAPLPARIPVTLQALPIELMHAITRLLPDHRDVVRLARLNASMRALFQHNDGLLLAPSRYRMQVDRIDRQTDIGALVAGVMAARMGYEETAAILLAISAKVPGLPKFKRADGAIALIDALGTLPDSVLAKRIGGRALIQHCVDFYCRAFNSDTYDDAQSVIDRLFQVIDSTRSKEVQGLTMLGLVRAIGWLDTSVQGKLTPRILERVAALPPEHQHGIRKPRQ